MLVQLGRQPRGKASTMRHSLAFAGKKRMRIVRHVALSSVVTAALFFALDTVTSRGRAMPGEPVHALPPLLTHAAVSATARGDPIRSGTPGEEDQRVQLQAGLGGPGDQASADATAKLYNVSSAPVAAVAWARKWIRSGACKDEPNALIVSCCRQHCGGISDRVRGLVTLALAAERARRPLCLNREYFLPGPSPACEEGAFLYITHDAFNVYSEPWIKRGQAPTVTRMSNRSEPVAENPAQNVRYISSVLASKSMQIGVAGRADAKRFGMLALALSGVLSRDMLRTQSMISERIGSPLQSLAHVAIHIRCGASSFENAAGVRVKAVSWADGYDSHVPDVLLRTLRTIPADATCLKPLYIASDSVLFKEELAKSLPSGIRTVTCCGTPVHVGQEGTDALTVFEEYQHLVDLEAIGTADAVFRTVGGFAELGAVSKTWHDVEQRSWPGNYERANEDDSDRDARNEFMLDLLTAMACTSSNLPASSVPKGGR
jgi:hypothetical protein